MRHSRLHQRKIDRLKLGEGIVESAYFQDFAFPAIPAKYVPDHLVQIDRLGEVRRATAPERVGRGVLAMGNRSAGGAKDFEDG